MQLYQNFVNPIQDKLNQLQVVRIATYAARQYVKSGAASNEKVDEAIRILEGLAKCRKEIGEQAYVVAAVEIASLQLLKGNSKAYPVELPKKEDDATRTSTTEQKETSGQTQESDVKMGGDQKEEEEEEDKKKPLTGTDFCKRTLENEAYTLQELKGKGLDPIVPATFYRVASEYYKVRGPAASYFSNAMQYLVHTPLQSLKEEDRHKLAVDIALAALVGNNVYNFGELVSHPILASLEGTQESWLSDMLHTFQHGDIQGFNNLIAQNRKAFEQQPILSANEESIKEKIALLAVMETGAKKPPHDRTLSFDEISQATQLKKDQVEWMLMRAMSLGLIKGHIDQVSEIVSITFIKPHVLDMSQIERLKSSLVSWESKVKEAQSLVEDGSVELFK